MWADQDTKSRNLEWRGRCQSMTKPREQRQTQEPRARKKDPEGEIADSGVQCPGKAAPQHGDQTDIRNGKV